MKGTTDYHRSAIRYNEALAAAAEGLENDPEITDEEVAKWGRGVGKQHRFHAKRHKAALAKLEKAEQAPENSGNQDVGQVEAQVATLEPADIPVEVATLTPAEVEVDVDLKKEN